jgi:hypothetical protein
MKKNHESRVMRRRDRFQVAQSRNKWQTLLNKTTNVKFYGMRGIAPIDEEPSVS